MIRAVLVVATLFVALGQATKAQSNACLDQLLNDIAGNIGAGPGYMINLQAGTIQRWMYKDGKWVIGTYKGAAVGANPQNPGPNVNLWPEGFGGQYGGGANLCTPEFLGAIFPTLAHEMLHFLCPPHSDKGVGAGPLFDLTKPPAASPTPPDCNDINYAVNSAMQVCDEIGAVGECCADEECEGLTDDNGDPIPGLERGNLKDYCKSLSDSYDKMQDRWNTEENANTAFGCNCPDPWDPGPGYANCPTMGSPPGGCDGTAQDAYPDNKVIPDCMNSCPEEC